MKATVNLVISQKKESDNPPEKYNVQFHFVNDNGIPYSNTRYIAFLENGEQKKWRNR